MLDVGEISTSAFHKRPFSMRGGVISERRIEHQGGQIAEFVLGLEPRSRVAVEGINQNPSAGSLLGPNRRLTGLGPARIATCSVHGEVSRQQRESSIGGRGRMFLSRFSWQARHPRLAAAKARISVLLILS